jgi:hypothetical protein
LSNSVCPFDYIVKAGQPAWARKGAVACRASGEVREIFFNPDPKGATEFSLAATSDYRPVNRR